MLMSQVHYLRYSYTKVELLKANAMLIVARYRSRENKKVANLGKGPSGRVQIDLNVFFTHEVPSISRSKRQSFLGAKALMRL